MNVAVALLIGQLLYKGYQNWDAGRMGDAEKAATASTESLEQAAGIIQPVTAESKARHLAPIQGKLQENLSMAGRTSATTGGTSGVDHSAFLEALRIGTGAEQAATSAAAKEAEEIRKAKEKLALDSQMALVQSELARKGVQQEARAQDTGITLAQAESAGEDLDWKEQIAGFAAGSYATT